MIGRNTFFILDFGLDSLNGVSSLHFQGDGLAGEGLHEDLHTTAESEDQVESGLLLDVVVRESSTVFQLLACEDQSLLVRGDALLVLDLSLHVLDRVGCFDLESDSLSCESLYEDLHVLLIALKLLFYFIDYNTFSELFIL